MTKYIFLISLAISGVFLAYFFWSQNIIKKKNQEILVSQITIETQELAFSQLETDISSIKNINSDLLIIERNNNTNSSELSDTLSGLDRIARQKPKIVEELVNTSAKERVRCISLATGAEKEIEEINNTCPHIISSQ